jgi:hypothetical protein
MTWALMWFWLVIPQAAPQPMMAFAMYGEEECIKRIDPEEGSYCVRVLR